MQTDIQNLRNALESDGTYRDINPLDTRSIELRRESIQALLTQLSDRLRTPGALPRTYDLAEGPTAPDCYVNGTLNGCFKYADHSISVGGTGHVWQATGTTMSHSAVVGDTVDGQLKPNITVGGQGFSHTSGTLSEDFSFSGVDCNSAAHTITSSATHLISFTLLGAMGESVQLNGSKNSPGGDSCEYKGLTVSVDPASIGLNETASISIGGLKECVGASASSSNTDVVTVTEANGTTFIAFPQSAGTATINASCGTQKGSASITVTAPEEGCNPAATSVDVGRTYDECNPAGGGDGGGGTNPDCGWYTYEISYDGGVTWYPYGEPFWYCPGGQNQTGIGRMQPDGRRTPVKVEYKVSLFGTTIPGRRTVIAYRDVKSHGNTLVVIDTTRASTMELEAVLQALASISEISDRDQSITDARMNAMTKPRSATAKARARGEDMVLLHNLLSARETSVKGIGKGRVLEATVLR